MALPDTSVKHFSSGMPGAPVLSGTAGTLIEVLDACLVNGFGSVTVDSLSVTDNVATATVSTGHGLSMIGSTGPVILISGATPAGLNGEWRVASVPNSTTFTFAVEGVANGTATGSITAKRAPAGWEKRYSGTNKAVYARTDPVATAMVLRVDDSPTQYPTLIMYETMTDVDMGAGASPMRYTVKSNQATASARQWRVFADDLALYWFIQSDNVTWYGNALFGDIIKTLPTDAFHCMLVASTAASATSSTIHLLSAAGDICRSYTQLGGAVSANQYASGLQTMRVGFGGMASYPSAVDNNVHASPIMVFESGLLRGIRPGMYSPLHDGQPADGTVVDDMLVNGDARTMIAQYMIGASNKSVALMDITGPWR